MGKTDRFANMAEVHAERERLKAASDKHQRALEGYWELVHDPGFRRGLAGDAFGDLLRAWKPLRTLGTLFQGDNGAMGQLLGMAVGSRARTFKGRLIAWAVAAVVPVLLKRFATPERLEHMATEVKRSWDRVRARMRERGGEE